MAHVSAAEGVAQQLWCRALGRGLASLNPTAGDEVLQSLVQPLAGLAAGKVDSSSAGEHSHSEGGCRPTKEGGALAQRGELSGVSCNRWTVPYSYKVTPATAMHPPDHTRTGTLLGLLAEDTREQLFQQRSEGYASPSAAGAEALGRAVARAFAAGRCSADTAACAACCLAESVMAEDDDDSSSSETLLVLQVGTRYLRQTCAEMSRYLCFMVST